MTTIPKTEIRRLKECQTLTASGSHMMAKKTAFAKAEAQGFVVSNPKIAEGDKIAFRTTDDGMRYLVSEEALDVLGEESGNQTGNEVVDAVAQHATVPTTEPTEINSQPTEQKTMTGFTIINVPNLEHYTKRTRAPSAPTYPFDELEVGQGFPVYPSEKMPEPWKSLQSTASTASRRYAKVTGETVTEGGRKIKTYDFERKFVVKRIKDPEGRDCAMVVRIPVDTGENATEAANA